MALPSSQFRALPWASRFLSSKTPSWKCTSCRNARQTPIVRRGFATSPKLADKPYYVTTPIFYVNAAPHVGHLYTMVLADIVKRWRVLLGEDDAQLLTGTDEHGMKVQQAAQAAGMDTQAFCDRNYKTFELLAKAANLDNDHFIRTTDPAHKEAVRYFWEMLAHRGYIYTAKHEGWYSVSDETFYPQAQVQSDLDPSTGRKRMVSAVTGKEVEWSSETNYHFRLSAFQDRLLELYKSGFVTPGKYLNNIVKSVESGLQDLSVSRPAERLTWGIPVPGDSSQTIYVWLDALVNYLTKAGYPFPPGHEGRMGWPADVHVVGKDITRFHCVYWPAFLMALDLPLPRQVMVHGHWTINHEKMSKSTGNVVNPFFAIDRFGVDTMRFYLARIGNTVEDSNYDNAYIIECYKKMLQWGLGNLAGRTIGCAKGNLRSLILKAASNELPPGNARDEEFQAFLAQMPMEVAGHMRDLNTHAAAKSITTIVEQTQKYFHEREPWKKSPESERVLYNVSEALRITGILLQPFMPGKSQQLLDTLKVDRNPAKRRFSAAGPGSDPDYGEGIQKNILFPPLIIEE